MNAPLPRYKILVVDDNVDCAEMLAETLALVGYDTQIAHDGQRALQLQQTFQPNAAVVDIGLPAMDGCELAVKLVQAAVSPIWLIALTGYSQESLREETLKAGFHAHLLKPTGIAQIADFLQRFAEARAQLH